MGDLKCDLIAAFHFHEKRFNAPRPVTFSSAEQDQSSTVTTRIVVRCVSHVSPPKSVRAMRSITNRLTSYLLQHERGLSFTCMAYWKREMPSHVMETPPSISCRS
jgi:hypothetical protein